MKSLGSIIAAVLMVLAGWVILAEPAVAQQRRNGGIAVYGGGPRYQYTPFYHPVPRGYSQYTDRSGRTVYQQDYVLKRHGQSLHPYQGGGQVISEPRRQPRVENAPPKPWFLR